MSLLNWRDEKNLVARFRAGNNGGLERLVEQR